MGCILGGLQKFDNTGKYFVLVHLYQVDNHTHQKNVCIFETWQAAEKFIKTNKLPKYGCKYKNPYLNVDLENYYEVQPIHFCVNGGFNIRNIYNCN